MQTGILIGVMILIAFLVIAIYITIMSSRKLVGLVPTPHEMIPEILGYMNLNKGDNLYELGAGDFRMLIRAYQEYEARGVGYEISPILGTLGKIAKIFQAGPRAEIDIIVGNLLNADFKSADVIYCHLNPVALESLKEKFDELTEDTVVYTYQNPIPGIELSKKNKIQLSNEVMLYQYTADELR
jgi:hypothetical protein